MTWGTQRASMRMEPSTACSASMEWGIRRESNSSMMCHLVLVQKWDVPQGTKADQASVTNTFTVPVIS